jgi:hypothetical protein
MSTELLRTPPAQRISARLQRIKARLLPPNTRPPDPIIKQYPNINKSKAITNLWSSRLRIWPILGSAVTSLQKNFLPR